MLRCDFIAAVTPPAPGSGAIHFAVPDGVWTTRDDGDALRAHLEQQVARERPSRIEVSFESVEAVTISYIDAFLGRLLTELTAAHRDPALILLSGLTEDTASEVDAVLERRKLLAAAIVDNAPTLLGADSYLRSTFVEAVRLGRFSPNEIADAMNVTAQNANNRLKRLVAMGALRRYRSDPASGGREYAYELHDGISSRAPS
jgi:hypothetical protein